MQDMSGMYLKMSDGSQFAWTSPSFDVATGGSGEHLSIVCAELADYHLLSN